MDFFRWSIIIAALCGPQMGFVQHMEKIPVRDVMVVFDKSGSMGSVIGKARELNGYNVAVDAFNRITLKMQESIAVI